MRTELFISLRLHGSLPAFFLFFTNLSFLFLSAILGCKFKVEAALLLSSLMMSVCDGYAADADAAMSLNSEII